MRETETQTPAQAPWWCLYMATPCPTRTYMPSVPLSHSTQNPKVRVEGLVFGTENAFPQSQVQHAHEGARGGAGGTVRATLHLKV